MSGAWDTECLVFGFIREFICDEDTSNSSQKIGSLEPLIDILYLCYMFTFKKSVHQYLCLINGTISGAETKANRGTIINLKTLKKYSINMYNIETNINKKKPYLLNCGHKLISCSATNTILPPWLLNKLKDPFNYNDGKIPKSLKTSIMNMQINEEINIDGYNMFFIMHQQNICLYIFNSNQLNPYNNDNK